MAATMMSAELARKYQLTPRDLASQGLIIQSAGYYGYKQRVISEHTVQILRELGYEPPLGRISEALTPQLLESAEVIYAMTRWHIDLILEVGPKAREKIFLLGENNDIADPIGSDLENYRRVGLEIQSAVKRLVEHY
jgi:protein-tyrosine-phosphatase